MKLEQEHLNTFQFTFNKLLKEREILWEIVRGVDHFVRTLPTDSDRVRMEDTWAGLIEKLPQDEFNESRDRAYKMSSGT